MRDSSYVLVIQHVPWEGLGLFQDFLEEEDLGFETVRLFIDQSIPLRKLEDDSCLAVIALGSPATAYQPTTNPHHHEEIELFRSIRKLRIPSFNVCYSMQLFCIAHGGKVAANPKGKEVGFYDVFPTSDGGRDRVLGNVGSFRTLQWHGDCIMHLPHGWIHLAYSEKTQYQAALVDDRHYLIQGDGQAAHPSTLREWFARDRTWASEDTGVDEKEILDEATKNQVYFRDVYRQIFRNFIDLARKERKLT